MDDRDSKQDDFWALYNPIERECIQDIESEEDLMERLREQKETALEKLWLTFQSAASSLAQLHKDRVPCDCCESCIYRQNQPDRDRWLPFQGAANKVTHLYKDGSDAFRAGIELGFHAGVQRRNRDITSWTKKKRRNVRREDLLLQLSGRSPPRKRESRSGSTLSLSPKPMEANDLLSFGENTKDFDFTSFVEGRNPFAPPSSTEGAAGRKRHGDINMLDSPHKRGRFT